MAFFFFSPETDFFDLALFFWVSFLSGHSPCLQFLHTCSPKKSANVPGGSAIPIPSGMLCITRVIPRFSKNYGIGFVTTIAGGGGDAEESFVDLPFFP